MTESSGETQPAKDDDPFVEAIIRGYTSIRGRMLAPGRQRIRKSHAKSLQTQGLASPVPREQRTQTATDTEEDA